MMWQPNIACANVSCEHASWNGDLATNEHCVQHTRPAVLGLLNFISSGNHGLCVNKTILSQHTMLHSHAAQ